ncbi:MAG: flagellar basal body P-ring formation protein FlgA [Gemmatimonadetes bacterium]|nr:flagellar basal body P-ring formation protein FlgA [Gemmatimonadota bacterium]NIY37212.1 flagellar basal body P-ring formation protein FlgA [Gemmatimonadota bacterium]
MRRFLAAFALTLATVSGAGAAQTQPQGPVLLKSRIVVEGPVLYLGDLFEGLGARGATPIARTPAPGKRTHVDARWLRAVAQAYGVPWRPGSHLDGASIERASVVIEAKQIEAAALDALKRRGLKGNVSLILDNPGRRLYLPSDTAPTLLVTGVAHDPETGRFTAHLVAPAQGTSLARATVTGRAVEMVDVPVLRRRVEPGEVVRERDVEWLTRRTDRLARNAVLEASTLFGKSPRRPIRAGEVVLASELREPILVRKGSLVTIRLRTARMILTAQGRAMEPGAKGDVIRVVNTKSNTVISATVTESGAVEVRPKVVSAEHQEGSR